ncbi:MAG: polysaccharide pyruvyl transferase family protein [bacterium]|nr:polysaccharide pyruvyl transferase family protein [bacterium]
MVKVGIMSMQRIANYGSFLQAYALKKILEELGCNVEFVDYHPGKTLMSPDSRIGIRRKICKAVGVLIINAPMKEKLKFINYKKNYAANYFPLLGITKERNYSPRLDLLVIGSDEVFNCVQSNTNVGFSPELFGQENKAKRLISYAASFGNTTEIKLREYKVIDQIKEWLQKFQAISVRDANSVQIIEVLLGKTPEYHLDPVLAYDFVSKCYKIPEKIPEENYLLLYGYTGRFSKKECKSIREYARDRGLKIFCIGGVQSACDNFIDCDPFKVIAYFQHAECVITDTFHGTILSVITHRQFVALIRYSGYSNSEKLTDLLDRLSLSQQIISDLSELPQKLEEQIIFYDVVDDILQRERIRSYEYLKKYTVEE